MSDEDTESKQSVSTKRLKLKSIEPTSRKTKLQINQACDKTGYNTSALTKFNFPDNVVFRLKDNRTTLSRHTQLSPLSTTPSELVPLIQKHSPFLNKTLLANIETKRPLKLNSLIGQTSDDDPVDFSNQDMIKEKINNKIAQLNARLFPTKWEDDLSSDSQTETEDQDHTMHRSLSQKKEKKKQILIQLQFEKILTSQNNMADQIQTFKQRLDQKQLNTDSHLQNISPRYNQIRSPSVLTQEPINKRTLSPKFTVQPVVRHDSVQKFKFNVVVAAINSLLGYFKQMSQKAPSFLLQKLFEKLTVHLENHQIKKAKEEILNFLEVTGPCKMNLAGGYFEALPSFKHLLIALQTIQTFYYQFSQEQSKRKKELSEQQLSVLYDEFEQMQMLFKHISKSVKKYNVGLPSKPQTIFLDYDRSIYNQYLGASLRATKFSKKSQRTKQTVKHNFQEETSPAYEQTEETPQPAESTQETTSAVEQSISQLVINKDQPEQLRLPSMVQFRIRHKTQIRQRPIMEERRNTLDQLHRLYVKYTQ